MPAIEALLPALRHHALRIIGSALVALLLASVSAGTYSPVEATNWSRDIAATRSRQVAYEAAMRAADQQVRSLRHTLKRAQRQLAKSKRHVRQARQRRADAKSRYAASVARLGIARDRLAAASAAPLPLTGLAERAVVPASFHLTGLMVERSGVLPGGEDIAPPEWSTGTVRSDQDVEPVRAAPLSIVADLPPEARGQAAADAQAPATDPPAPEAADTQPTVGVATQETVDVLEQQARMHARAFRKTQQRLRRAERGQRARARSVASLTWSRRAAVGRRGGAEAGLASAILSMSRLAQRRVAKKTNVRPGQNSSFAWPTRGRITQGYGCTGFHLNPPRGSCRHFHDGIDVAGYRGTPIRASAVGVVSYIGWNPWDQRQRAFMIVVAHPGGYETLYGHALPTRHVRVGQLVRRGQVIGYMGSTGRSTGVHLHLELRRGRISLNPLAFF